jgi:hypothetical protein
MFVDGDGTTNIELIEQIVEWGVHALNQKLNDSKVLHEINLHEEKYIFIQWRWNYYSV